MEFNIEKRKIIHIAKNNPKHTYNLDGKPLDETLKEKDLGVLIDFKLDFESHVNEIVGRTNRMVGMIRVSFACQNKKKNVPKSLHSTDKTITRKLCTGLVTPPTETYQTN